MAAPKGIIRIHQGEERILVRVEGWAQMHLGLALRRLAEQNLARGATTLLVDLRQCGYMDSTFVGTLLYLKRATDRRGCCGFSLIAPSTECCQLLKDLGLDDFFAVGRAEDVAAEDWTTVCLEVDDTQAFHRNVAQAHIELAGLPGRAGEPFKKVARLLAEDLAKCNKPPGDGR